MLWQQFWLGALASLPGPDMAWPQPGGWYCDGRHDDWQQRPPKGKGKGKGKPWGKGGMVPLSSALARVREAVQEQQALAQMAPYVQERQGWPSDQWAPGNPGAAPVVGDGGPSFTQGLLSGRWAYRWARRRQARSLAW